MDSGGLKYPTPSDACGGAACEAAGQEREVLIETRTRTIQKNNRAKILFSWLIFSSLLLAINSIILWLDHRPMFFLGDSASYIWTAVGGGLPPDRSFIYGYFIRLIAVTSKSLISLVVIQVLLGCAASAVAAHLLIRYFQVRPWLAFITGLLISLEPLQLLYTRYVMTETLALTIFVLYVWAILNYLENIRIKGLAVMHAMATVLISLRLAFIPMAWIAAASIPFLALPAIALKARLAGSKSLNQLLLHVVVSLVLLLVFTSVYEHMHGHLQRKPPAYSYHGGFLH